MRFGRELVWGLAGIMALTTQTKSTRANLYDDFSSGVLDNSKWIENPWHSRPFTDEHYVNSVEGVYHIAQNNVGDAETNLTPNRQFNAGESLYYEISYRGGSGNNASQPLINGNYPPTQLETCFFQTAGCGVIGYWNDFPDLGNQSGTYRINNEFFQDSVRMTATKPDNSIVINTFTGNSSPYTFTLNTHTGHNGLMHFDIDNVYINGIPEPTTLGLLSAGLLSLRRKRN